MVSRTELQHNMIAEKSFGILLEQELTMAAFCSVKREEKSCCSSVEQSERNEAIVERSWCLVGDDDISFSFFNSIRIFNLIQKRELNTMVKNENKLNLFL